MTGMLESAAEACGGALAEGVGVAVSERALAAGAECATSSGVRSIANATPPATTSSPMAAPITTGMRRDRGSTTASERSGSAGDDKGS